MQESTTLREFFNKIKRMTTTMNSAASSAISTVGDALQTTGSSVFGFLKKAPRRFWEFAIEEPTAYSKKEQKDPNLTPSKIFKQFIGFLLSTTVGLLARLTYGVILSTIAFGYFAAIFMIANAIAPGFGPMIFSGAFLTIAIPTSLAIPVITNAIISDGVKKFFSGPLDIIGAKLSYLMNEGIGGKDPGKGDMFKHIVTLTHKAGFNAAGHFLNAMSLLVSLPGIAIDAVFGGKTEKTPESEKIDENSESPEQNNDYTDVKQALSEEYKGLGNSLIIHKFNKFEDMNQKRQQDLEQISAIMDPKPSRLKRRVSI